MVSSINQASLLWFIISAETPFIELWLCYKSHIIYYPYTEYTLTDYSGTQQHYQNGGAVSISIRNSVFWGMTVQPWKYFTTCSVEEEDGVGRVALQGPGKFQLYTDFPCNLTQGLKAGQGGI